MKKYILFLFFTVLVAMPNLLSAQHMSATKGKSFLGFGMGVPFGGFGGRLSYNPLDQFTVFGGMGYNLNGLAANTGFQYGIQGQKRTEFYFTGMYGYNSVILIEGTDRYNKTYSGLSLGAGLKINSLRFEGSYWDIGLLAPFRAKNYHEDLLNIKMSRMVEINSEPLPVLFYFGYNFMLSAK